MNDYITRRANSPSLSVDTNNSLFEIGQIAYETAIDKGFNFDNFGEQIALMHSELSEALEAGRQEPQQDQHCTAYLNLDIELADVILRILGYCYAHNIEIADAVLAKLQYNITRPAKHGGKKF